MAFAKMPAVMRSSQLETGLFSPDGGARLSLAPLDRGEDPASNWLVAGKRAVPDRPVRSDSSTARVSQPERGVAQ